MNEQFDRQNEAGVRLNKWIAESGFCSRREADRLISEGKVTIDGRTGVLGDKVLPGMKVRVDGREAVVKTKKVYIALNKPAGVVCTADPREPMNVVDYVGHPGAHIPHRAAGQGFRGAAAHDQRRRDRQPHTARGRRP